MEQIYFYEKKNQVISAQYFERFLLRWQHADDDGLGHLHSQFHH